MQQTIKTYRALASLILLAAGPLLISGCSGNSKTGTSDSSMKSTDTMPAKMMPADSAAKKDSLPPIDTTVSHRPETRKT